MFKGTILLVEDEKYMRNTLSLVLENAGYHVVEAENGQHALRLILQLKSSTHPVDLMLLDSEVSGLTGWQVLAELKQYHLSVPTIVIMGLIEQRTFQHIPGNGEVEYLKKPLHPEEVIAGVSRILQRMDVLEKSVNGGGETVKLRHS